MNGDTPSDKGGFKKDKKRDNRRESKSGRNTPDVPKNNGTPSIPETSSTPATGTPEPTEEPKSPSDSTRSGVRSHKPHRPARNPWTIFMKMPPTTSVTEEDIRVFFAEAKQEVS